MNCGTSFLTVNSYKKNVNGCFKAVRLLSGVCASTSTSMTFTGIRSLSFSLSVVLGLT